MSPHEDRRVFVQQWAFLEDCSNRSRENKSTAKAPHAEFPSLLSFPRAGVDACHKKHDICRGGDVEDFETEIPPQYPSPNHRCPE